MDARGTGVYLDPDYAEKFQHSSDYNYLGVNPPSPKFYRRIPSPIRSTAPVDLGIALRNGCLHKQLIKSALCRWQLCSRSVDYSNEGIKHEYFVRTATYSATGSRLCGCRAE